MLKECGKCDTSQVETTVWAQGGCGTVVRHRLGIIIRSRGVLPDPHRRSRMLSHIRLSFYNILDSIDSDFVHTTHKEETSIGVEFIEVDAPNAITAFVPVEESHVGTLANCSTSSTARYPDNSQPNTSFPILIRTCPTSKIPAVPLSWGPKLAFNAGIIVFGKFRTVGKRRASSFW